MAKHEKIGDEVIAYQGRLLEIVNQEMSAGDKTINFEWARRAPGVRLILVDPKRSVVLLTKEHRYEIDATDYRLPGGKVFDSLVEYNEFLKSGRDIQEPAIAKAREEGSEEAGVKIKSLVYCHTSICGTTVQWDLLYFVSTDWEKFAQALGEGEEISTIEVDFNEAKQIALDGRMSEERSALILLRYLNENA